MTSGAMVTEYCCNYLYVTRENPENNDTKNVLPVDYSFSGLLGLLCRNGNGPLPTRLEAEADRGEQGDWVVCCAGGGEIGKDRSDGGANLNPCPEKPQAIVQDGTCGCAPMMKCSSGVMV